MKLRPCPLPARAPGQTARGDRIVGLTMIVLTSFAAAMFIAGLLADGFRIDLFSLVMLASCPVLAWVGWSAYRRGAE